MDSSSDNLGAWSLYPYDTDNTYFIPLLFSHISPAVLHASWNGECFGCGIQDRLLHLRVCSLPLALMAVPNIFLPALQGWLFCSRWQLKCQAELCVAMLGFIHTRSVPLLSLLGESLCPRRPFPVSVFKGDICGVLSNLLKLVELKPANPFRTKINLYRWEVTKMPSQKQSVCYTENSG